MRDFIRRGGSNLKSLPAIVICRGSGIMCPFCGSEFGRFLNSGIDSPTLRKYNAIPPGKRPNSKCPRCGSIDRERLMYLYLKSRTSLLSKGNLVLHVAPEKSLGRVLSVAVGDNYIGIDLALTTMARMDLEDLGFKDDSFDLVICSHVLEHVRNDLRAIRELRRVIRPSGTALIQVPISWSLENTIEDESVASPEGRYEMFGQSDHVRLYGRDYLSRLGMGGLDVTLFDPVKELGEEVMRRYALQPGEKLFVCFKRCVLPSDRRPPSGFESHRCVRP